MRMSATANLRRAGPLLVVAGLVGVGPGAGSASGQQTAGEEAERSRARLEQALPPGDLMRIRDMARELAAEGIPPQLIRRKALEGIAKGVPPDRIVGVLEDYSIRLREARRLLPDGGAAVADGPGLAAAAEAVRRGVPPDAIRGVAQEAAGSAAYAGGRRLAVPLLVLGDLTEAGVPADQALELVQEGMRRGAPEQGMLNFSAAVQRRIRLGEDPATAFQQVRIRAMEQMRVSPGESMSPSRGDGARRPADASPVPPGSEPPRGSDGMRRGPGPN